MKTGNNLLNIVLVHYRFFISGGPERYLFNIIEKFEQEGHSVIPFSVKHPKNRNSKYADFFLSSLTNDENTVLFNQIQKNPKTLIKLFDRNFYSFEAKKKLRAVINNFNVNIAYCLSYFRWISPSIITELHRFNIPIIVRISDFAYLCPEVHLLRNGKICELCTKGNFLYSIRYKCVQNSFLLSLINHLSMSLHKKLKILDKIDAFVCPSAFTAEKMIEAGFDRKKIFHVPTFIDSKRIAPQFKQGNYILYFGRISQEKGISVLLDAFEKLKSGKNKAPIPLYIVGKFYGKQTEQLRKRICLSSDKDVRILDECEKDSLYPIIKNSAFTVVPSICYDNMPNVILESFAAGKAVIGSRIGSIPELVKHEETGLLFKAGDSNDLAEKMQWMINHPEECSRMGQNARKLVESEYNPELHYQRIMQVFKLFL